MPQLRTALFLSLCLLIASSGCQCGGGPVELQSHSGDDSIIVDSDNEQQLSVQNREAVVVVFDGVKPLHEDLGVEINRVIDADVYAGPDERAGDPHWITRSRVLDADGHPLWTQRVNSLFQLMEFLQVIIDEISPLNLTVDHVYSIARQNYPELLEFAIKVPTELRGGETYVMEVNDKEGNWNLIASYDIDDLVERAEPANPDFYYEIDPLVKTGPSSDRLNIAILGDGYTDSERHIFEADAQAVSDRFMATTPMNEHGDLFNINAVWTPSAESGVGFDCNHAGAADDCEHGFRDTIFDTVFVIPALAEEFQFPAEDVSDRVAMPMQLGRIYEVAALASYDEIILLANSPKRSGFAGLYVALVTNFDDRDVFPDVAVHEVGHTLGLLGDEYHNSHDACYFNEPTIPLPANIAEIDDGYVKWSDWVDDSTPIPTPANTSYENDIGAFERAYNCDFLVRPARYCKMNRSTDEFCSVCAEQMVRRFYSWVDPAPQTDPPTARLMADNVLKLEVPVRDDDRYEVLWTIEGIPPILGDSPSITVDSRELSSTDWVDVQVLVRNKTDFIRTADEAVESEFSFRLRLAD